MDTNELIKFVSDGFDRAKGGAAVEVYAEVIPYYASRALPLKSHYAFGWIIYYALHQSPAHAIRERKQMLAHYLGLQVERPHKLHSMILTEAFRLYKDAAESAFTTRNKEGFHPVTDATRFSIVKFIDLWDLNNLRPGDWRRKEHEGKELSSTVEKLITCYVDELYAAKIPASPEFMAIIGRAIKEYPAGSNLYAQCAQLYELAGDKEAAIGMLRNAILASSSKFYLWSRLAALITDNDELRLKVSLLYKALRCPGQEEFKGKIHLNLAAALAEGGAYPQAKWELKYVKGFYENKDWNLPHLYRDTEKKIPAGTQAADPATIYKRVESLADDYIYESLPNIQVKKTFHKLASETTDRYGNRRPGRAAWRVTDALGANYWLTPSYFNIPDNLPTDTHLNIKVFNGKVVKAFL
ncbi:MAG: hypothetical protein K2L45_12945 [Muribaculaceae bacterium]|nr:hypothetical protein [Muribaculaceae bacterium]MDE6631784.1 hypothetical protein [Muribaculaceae bacterium]